MNNIPLGSAMAVVGIFVTIISNKVAGVTMPTFEEMNAGSIIGQIIFILGAIEVVGGPITWLYNKLFNKKD